MSEITETRWREGEHDLTLGNSGVKLKKALEPEDLAFLPTPKRIFYLFFPSVAGFPIGCEAGSIHGVLRSRAFIDIMNSPTSLVPSDVNISSILTLLPCGALVGSIAAGYIAESIGRRYTVIAASWVYFVGIVVQMMVGVGRSNGLAAILTGRFIAGIGIGAISTGTILYMAEACHHKSRGACVAAFQCFITLGYLAAIIAVYVIGSGGQHLAYRTFIGIQLVCPLILGTSLYVMPESPRYLVHHAKFEEAYHSFQQLRGLQPDMSSVQFEISEVILEKAESTPLTVPLYEWVVLWTKGHPDSSVGRWDEPSVPRWFVGILIQMMHEWTGISFILYFTTRIFESAESVIDPYIVLLILAIVNACSTPISMWTVDYFGRRYVLIVGTCGMIASHFINAIVGVTVGIDRGRQESTGWVPDNSQAVKTQVAMMAVFVFFYASSWGPASWVVVGEIFHPTDRSRAVGFSIAGQWFFRLIITAASPYVTGRSHGNQQSRSFFIWGSLCVLNLSLTYFLVPEAKGLTLEQTSIMLDDTGPRKSSAWKRTTVATKRKRLNQTAAA